MFRGVFVQLIKYIAMVIRNAQNHSLIVRINLRKDSSFVKIIQMQEAQFTAYWVD